MDDVPISLADLTMGPVRYPILSSKALAEGDFGIEYLIDGVLVEGQPAIWGGAQKAMKTCTLVDAGISLATASPFLGNFPAKKRRVLLMSGESGIAVLQETGVRVARAKGLELAGIDNLLWSDALPRFGDKSSLLAIDRVIKAEGVEVLAVDPAYLAIHTQRPGDVFEMGSLLAGMNDVCRTHGVTMILAHHTKKKEKTLYHPPELHDLMWSGFCEWARQWILLGRRERFEPGTGLHRLWLVVGGSAGHSGQWALDIDEGTEKPRKWEVSLRSVDELDQADQHDSELKADHKVEKKKLRRTNKLLEALQKFPGETLNTLRDIASCSGGKAKESMQTLIELGRARVEKTIRRGRDTEIYFPVGGEA